MELDNFQADNLANWDDRVEVHISSSDYGLDRYVSDSTRISDVVRFDAPLFGEISGLSVAHLQCHIGTDTISLARLGADVTGLDFSAKAIDAARELSSRCGTPAKFVHANVYDAAAALDQKFDFVYSSVGAINWLADINRWAAAVSGVLKPGGRLYVREMHPSLWIFEEVDGEIVPTYPYYNEKNQPLSFDEARTYTDGDHSKIEHGRHHEWTHSLSEIVTALADNRMVVNRMADHQGIEWEVIPSAIKEGRQWFLPGKLREMVPAMFSLWATRR